MQIAPNPTLSKSHHTDWLVLEGETSSPNTLSDDILKEFGKKKILSADTLDGREVLVLRNKTLFERILHLFHFKKKCQRIDHITQVLIDRLAEKKLDKNNVPLVSQIISKLTLKNSQSAQNNVKKLFKKASKHEGSNALYNLGLCYYRGEGGLTQDYTKAAVCLQQAAKKGHPDAYYRLGECYYDQEKYESALGNFEMVSNQNDPKIQLLIGLCRYKLKDEEKAVEYFKKAADQGNSDAQFHLGLCYYKGKGVTKDYTQAAEFFKKAADEAQLEARYYFGLCYFEGKGVKKNIDRARYYLELPTQNGHLEAQYLLGLYHLEKKSPKLATIHLKKAANRGHNDAQKKLGEINTNSNEYENRQK